ncbi:MAG: SEC-C domain-containing protein [Bacteroidaceae bacterium]|nr:SEC-C domain-containing protein [Bacteroidaceae bacterium]
MKDKAQKIISHLFEDDFDIDTTIVEVDVLRKGYQKQHDEENANVAWATQEIVCLHRDYRKTFFMLKNKQYYEAWCMLEKIEIGIANLLRNFSGVKNAVEYISIIVRQLQSLYPYKVFLSTELLIKERRCGICGKKRSIRHHCGHFIGHVYNGELCCDYVEKCALEGISLVFNPEHKYAVTFARNGEDDHEDHYNYKLLEGLMDFWEGPYYPWYYTTRHIHISPDEYPGLRGDDFCPCGSGKKYGDCCKDDPEGVKHVVYEFRSGINRR